MYVNKGSDAASGGAGWALAHLEFWSSVNPIKTRGADFAHHITASPPGFENPAAFLLIIGAKNMYLKCSLYSRWASYKEINVLGVLENGTR